MSDKSRALEAEERAEYEAREADVLRARIAELEEAARRYFNADGSVSLMVSAEAVVEARKAAALRIAELEAQVREQREALKVARKAFNAMANEPIGPMDASDREVLQACEAVALDALAHPLIGGAK